MGHINKRFCLVPFSELVACPDMVHFAIGSPYFDSLGHTLFPDPIIVAVRSDILSSDLPHCTAVGASCNTRPYNSYGYLMKKIFEETQPHRYPSVRQGLEGVMEIGDVRAIPSGGLSSQTNSVLLGCVSPMTGVTNVDILEDALDNYAKTFASMPPGSTLRMPLVGTGKALGDEEGLEAVVRKVIQMNLNHFAPILLPEDKRMAPRKLLLIHPFEFESHLIATSVAEKAILLTLMDKMGIVAYDKRIVYGLAHGEKKEEQFVEKETFVDALEHFDEALNELLKGERRESMKKAARGAEMEPALSGMYQYISHLASQRKGLTEVIAGETLALARSGQIYEALSTAHILKKISNGSKEKVFIQSLYDCYVDSCTASLEARLLYENYMEAEQIYQNQKNKVQSLEQFYEQDFQDFEGRIRTSLTKIPKTVANNTFHIVIRKFMSSMMETLGARRALDNMLGYKQQGKMELSPEDESISQELYDLAKYIEESKKSGLPHQEIQPKVLENLIRLLPGHSTLRLEAGRYYLKSSRHKKGRERALTRNDLISAWEHFNKGEQENPHDYGILSYIGFFILLQGNRFFPLAVEYFTLVSKLIDTELQEGRFGIRKLRSLHGENIEVHQRDAKVQRAQEYFIQYQNCVQIFAKFAQSLNHSETIVAVDLYHKAMISLQEVGRHDLAKLYNENMGPNWVRLVCRHQKIIGSIPLPFGEISLDFLWRIWKKAVYWWKYRRVRSHKIRKVVREFVENFEQKADIERYTS